MQSGEKTKKLRPFFHAFSQILYHRVGEVGLHSDMGGRLFCKFYSLKKSIAWNDKIEIRMQKSFHFAHIPLLFFFFSPTFEGETAYLSVQNGWVSNARCKLLIFNRIKTENCPHGCRDTRLVHPPQQSCIYAFNFTWTNARPVRPYMQSHPYYNSISAISSCDITHFARWNGPFLSLNRVISDGQMMYFVSRNSLFVS